MIITPSQLKILLVGSNLLSDEVFTKSLEGAKKENVELGEYMVNKGILSDTNLGQLLANFLRINYVNLSAKKYLGELGIYIESEDIGGTIGRNAKLQLSNGLLSVSSVM
ncbi:MAG: hypothetical protein HQ488_02470 [Parcubacteria group bacterium]|nr:hypothetical protein [Parcubacteria group bacterium]